MQSHGEDLRDVSGDVTMAAAVMNDWRTAPLSPADRALCAFAEKLTATPGRMNDDDVAALRGEGFSDEAIHDATQVISYFNYINRIADALGTDLEPGMPPRPRSWYPEPKAVPPIAPGAKVTLEPVTKENLSTILRLQVSAYQQRFVASNAVSLAQAAYHEGLECLAIAADGELAGFTMLEHQREKEALYIVRFLVDARFQGLGIGKSAMERILERARGMEGVRRVTLSYVPAPGSPEPFYRRRGFIATGAMDEDGELEMEMVIER